MAKTEKLLADKKTFLVCFLISLLISLILFSAFFEFREKTGQKKEAPSDLASIQPLPTLAPIPFSPVSLLVTGDVMLARSVTAKMRHLDDFSYPFAKTESVLKSPDLTLINLESPLGNNCPTLETGMKFCADFRAIRGLIDSGVDLVSLANNHALDQGEIGLSETVRLIKDNFMDLLGLREPVFLEVKGIKFVFLAYNAVLPKSNLIAWADPAVVTSQIKRFRSEADVLIIFFHWGKEYESVPMAGSGCPIEPKKLAHLAIEAGADLVLGTHPHVVQKNEWYQGKLIVYSLGNFIFDQNWSTATQQGIVGKFIFNKKGLISSQFLPVATKDYQPRWLDEVETASGSAWLE